MGSSLFFIVTYFSLRQSVQVVTLLLIESSFPETDSVQFISQSVYYLNRLWAPAATVYPNDHKDPKPRWTLAGMYEATHHFQLSLGNYLSPTTESTTAIQRSLLRL